MPLYRKIRLAYLLNDIATGIAFCALLLVP